MLNTPRQSALILSRGTILDTTWPAIRDLFPDGSTTEIKFYDSSGTTIATVPGSTTPKNLVYLYTDIGILDSVPNGAHYELFVATEEGHVYKYEYGTVIRREATFYTPPPTSLEGESREFTDLMARSSIGRRWVVTSGGIAMHVTNTGAYAMGPDIGLLFSQAGIRYFRPMGGDSWRIKFQVRYNGTGIGPGGWGIMRCIMGCDINLTTGMGFEVEVGAGNTGIVYTGIVTGPTDMAHTNSVADAVGDGEFWTIEYSDVTKTLSAYEGADPTGTDPVITWSDDDNVLPHGPGFRYWGFSWDASVLATGPLIGMVEAQDYV